MFQPLNEAFTRRQALLITPIAFAGLLVTLSRKRDPKETARTSGESEVDLILFTDAGESLGTKRAKKLVRSNAEWRKLLTAEQYYVTREKGTDTAFTGTYYQVHDAGLYRCVCCGSAVFNSAGKYDSGTGWPSFTAPIAENNIYTQADRSLLPERTEVICTRCDAHLGHLFMDGPEPAYSRYCINESALRFISV